MKGPVDVQVVWDCNDDQVVDAVDGHCCNRRVLNGEHRACLNVLLHSRTRDQPAASHYTVRGHNHHHCLVK